MWSKLKLVRYCTRLVEHMQKEKVVPDVLSCPPHQKAKVVYPTGAVADCGNELTPTLVRHCPAVHWYAEYVYYYTICMIDPDVPCRKNPVCREWNHWLVVNVPGNCINSGDIIAEYVGACPQKDTGVHRYVFLVFKQHQKCQFKETRLSKNSYCGRDKFSVKDFACSYSLGEPIAGNFFLAEFDCYVPLLNKQLGICPPPIPEK